MKTQIQKRYQKTKGRERHQFCDQRITMQFQHKINHFHFFLSLSLSLSLSECSGRGSRNSLLYKFLAPLFFIGMIGSTQFWGVYTIKKNENQ